MRFHLVFRKSNFTKNWLGTFIGIADFSLVFSKPNVNKYLYEFNSIRLRWNSLTKNINPSFSIVNFDQLKP